MSWNVRVADVNPAEVEEAAAKEYADFKARYSDEDAAIKAMDEQFDAALEAARVLLRLGGFIPDPRTGSQGNVNVTFSGHANPGHLPRRGWANDVVTVSVSSAASPPDK